MFIMCSMNLTMWNVCRFYTKPGRRQKGMSNVCLWVGELTEALFLSQACCFFCNKGITWVHIISFDNITGTVLFCVFSHLSLLRCSLSEKPGWTWSWQTHLWASEPLWDHNTCAQLLCVDGYLQPFLGEPCSGCWRSNCIFTVLNYFLI